jgi:signal transduction histidine kinase
MQAEHEHRHGQLREANERLVLAALTAQELQAAAEDAQRPQTEFLAVIAHELRSPLSPIRTAAEMLGHLRSDEPLLARVQTIIERQVAHMSRLVGDLLDVSRVNTGKLRLERRLVDTAVVIAAAADACGPAMETRRQHFDARCLHAVWKSMVTRCALRKSLLTCSTTPPSTCRMKVGSSYQYRRSMTRLC